MRRLALVVVAVGVLLVAGAPPAAALHGPRPLSIVAVPDEVARQIIGESRVRLVGVALVPGSRSAREAILGLGAGSPGRSPTTLVEALTNAGIPVSYRRAPTLGGAPWDAFDEIVPAPTPGAGPTEHKGVRFVIDDDPERALEAVGPRDLLLIIGVRDQAPLRVALAVTSGPSSLFLGTGRRPGIMTSYDMTTYIARVAGGTSFTDGPVVEVPGAVGSVPYRQGPQIEGDPIASTDALIARLRRDAAFRQHLTFITVGFALGGLLGAAVLRPRRPRLSDAFVRGTALVPAGYVAGLFIPGGTGARAVGLVVAFALGAVARIDVRRFIGAALLATSASIALLAVAAALRPGGEVAMSLWGSPLELGRMYGLHNHLAAFLSGGLIAGLALLGVSRAWFVVPVVAGLVVVGAPHIGAQFIGVTTLAFGAALAFVMLVRRRAEPWHALGAGAIALAATVIAMLSDLAARTTHGGAAAGSIGSEGWSAAWRIVADRARLNYDEVVRLGIVGPFIFVALVLAAVAMLVWVARYGGVSDSVRAAVYGGAATALLTLFIEDSGFFVGAILMLYPALALLVWRSREADPSRDGVVARALAP